MSLPIPSRRVVLAGAAAFAAIPLAVRAEDVTAFQKVRVRALVGDLHLPQAAPARSTAVMVLGGSEGGLRYSTANARDLAQAGFPAFATAYFGMEGLPPYLEEIPLEYFFKDPYARGVMAGSIRLASML